MTARSLFARQGTSWAGLAVGATAWAISTQLNYALVPLACQRGWNFVPAIAALLAIVSLLGALSSWLVWRRHDGPGMHVPKQDGCSRYLLSGIGIAAGVLFALVVALQGLAAVLLDPCLR